MPFSELSEQQQALIANRIRVWEVRRFCQVLPSVIKYARGADSSLISQPLKPHDCSQNVPDGALAALLRCLVHRMGVDLAMVSLLDDHTQYFVSGASRTNVNDVKVTLDSTKWYGCESVSHHGGLCERTITMQNRPGNMALYEELDMAKLDRTKDLPFVKGEIAEFRHYAGVPLNPYGGPNIGTVFIFCEAPSDEGLSQEDRSYLFEIASYIIRYLEQAMEALEGKRVLRFNKAFASLLDAEIYTKVTSDVVNERSEQRETVVSNLYTEATLRLYQLAANLLQDTFEFDGVRIHEVDQFGSYTNNNPDWNGSKVLAEHLGSMEQHLGDPSQPFLERLLEMFPQGCVIQTLGSSDSIVAATNAGQVVLIVDELISTELPQVFPAAKQIIIMPLWDTHRERNIGAVLGFANDQSRVYLSSTDLLSMSAFCTTLMTQVRRLEVQAMDKIKSDFLGSMSHEMRTPLHGILSALELLADTPYNADQRDLLETARYSSISLLNTIEHVLHFSKISSTARGLEETRSNGSSVWTGQQSSPRYPQTVAIPVKRQTSKMVSICEEAFQREVRNLRLRDTMQHQFPSHSERTEGGSSSPPLPAHSPGPKHHPAMFFDTNISLSCTLTALASFRAVFTHLLNNALKFSYPTGCVRVTLDVDENFCTLRFIDAGKGINPDFLRHSIFEAFSQEDPLVEGTGLGLSIVKRTITALGGRLDVESKESCGSIFTATLPSKRVVFDPSYITELGAANLPELQMSVFAPSRWAREGGVRGDRCNEMLLTSLTRSLGRWFRVTVTPWQSCSTGLRLLVVVEEDLVDAKQTHGGIFGHDKCLVLRPDLQTTLESDNALLDNTTTIIGPVTPSSLQEALTCLFPDLVVPPYLHDDYDQLQTLVEESTETILAAGSGEEETDGLASEDALSQLASQLTIEPTLQENDIAQTTSKEAMSLEPIPRAGGKGSPDGVTADTVTKLTINNMRSDAQPRASAEPVHVLSQKHSTREPKLLLVDDNPVNLKVLSMYAQKCSKIKAKSVDGGQKAIDAFKEAFFNQDEASQRFDLIFLDLSMPEVSGFDVARQIREIETHSECQSRVYICALTGLSSDKDRNAAYASGVDQYLVKPTRLGDLQWVVGRWRDSLVCE